MTAELRWRLYAASFAVGFAMLLLITALRRKIYNVSLPRALAYGVYTFLSGFCGAVVIAQIYNLLASLKGVQAAMLVDVLGAVVFSSLFLLASTYTEKAVLKRRARNGPALSGGQTPRREASFRDTMDLVIPGAFTVFACIKIGCLFRGCCFGFECSWGIETPFYYLKTTFPVQIFESACLFAAAAASHYVQRAAFYRRGMSGPFAAFLYGLSRFFWEFFRWNPPEMKRFFLGLTIWQLFCLLIFAVAGAWIFILIKTQPREPRAKVKPFAAEKKRGRPKARGKTKEWLPSFKKPEKRKIVHGKKRKKKNH